MEDNNISGKITMNIFGSCVSRDVLEVQQERKISLRNYIARESIVSAVSRPVLLETDRLNLDSNFQKNMVMHDFQKDAFELFKKERSDVILIDLIEERFPLAKIDDSYVTYSNELMLSAYIDKPKLIRWHKKASPMRWLSKGKDCKWEIGKINADKVIAEFSQRLLGLYHSSQIIMHEVYLSDCYINSEKQVCLFPKNHLKNNKMVNEQYEYMYHRFEKCIPGVQIINCSKEYMADENHKWGLSPMHFQKEYYEKVLEEIYRITTVIEKTRRQEKC